MILEQFISINNILPGDAVVVKKSEIGVLDHYLIYLGQNWGEHKFIANYIYGTRILTAKELQRYSLTYGVERIRRFIGNPVQRNAAVQRALSMRDVASYHLLFNNCEHFANEVQNNSAYSQQTRTFGAGMALTGWAVAAASRSGAGKGVGAVMALLGFMTYLSEKENK
jgi:hypothetical protein